MNAKKVFSSQYRTVSSGGNNTYATAVFHPMTGPLPSSWFVEVKLGVVTVDSELEVQPGIQYSADGSTWDTPQAIALETASNWVLGSNNKYYPYTECPDGFVGSGSSGPTERLLVRFGLFVKNKSGVTGNAFANVKLTFSPSKVGVGGAISDSLVCTTDGASGQFTPLTGIVPTTAAASVRASWTTSFMTGDVRVIPAFQTSNDGHSWSSHTALTGTARTTDGTTLGTTWQSPDYGGDTYARFGTYLDHSSSGTSNDSATCQLTIETRDK